MNNRFFPMPYDIFCLGLRMPEIALYSYLMSCENRKNYTCYPSYKTIARTLNTSVNTVQKYVKALEEKELISTEHTKIFTQNGLKLNGNLLSKQRLITLIKANWIRQCLKVRRT